jgi:hypothetical protein
MHYGVGSLGSLGYFGGHVAASPVREIPWGCMGNARYLNFLTQLVSCTP